MKKTLWDPFADFRKDVLSNGLTIYSAYWDRPWFRACFNVHVGSLTDPSGKEGMVHFLEHLLSENVTGLSKKEIERFFKGMGGNANLGITGLYASWYQFKIPANTIALKESLPIFGKMILDARLDVDIDIERKVIVREFREKFPCDMLYERNFLRKYLMLFHGTSMGKYKGGLGTPETINTITKQDLQSFHDAYFVPQNMSIVVIGGIQHEDLLGVFESSSFGETKEGLINPQLEQFSEVHLPLEEKYYLNVSEFFRDSVGLIDVASYETDVLLPGVVNYEKVSILVDMLDVLLNDEMREKLGGSYNFSAGFQNFIEIIMVWISGIVDPKLVDETEKITVACISRIASEEKLFQSIKKERLNSLYLRDYSGRQCCEFASEDVRMFRKIITLAETVRDVSAVTFKDVCELAQYMLPQERRWTSIQRP